MGIHLKVTGQDPNKTDLLEICAIPLDEFYDRDRDAPFFHLLMHSRHPGTYEPKLANLNNVDVKKIYTGACDYYDGGGLFTEWLFDLTKDLGKVQLVGFDLQHQHRWLKDFLTETIYAKYISDVDRDLLQLIGYINDKSNLAHQRIPLGGFTLESLAYQLDIEFELKGDCVLTADLIIKLYKRMLQK